MLVTIYSDHPCSRRNKIHLPQEFVSAKDVTEGQMFIKHFCRNEQYYTYLSWFFFNYLSWVFQFQGYAPVPYWHPHRPLPYCFQRHHKLWKCQWIESTTQFLKITRSISSKTWIESTTQFLEITRSISSKTGDKLCFLTLVFLFPAWQ